MYLPIYKEVDSQSLKYTGTSFNVFEEFFVLLKSTDVTISVFATKYKVYAPTDFTLLIANRDTKPVKKVGLHSPSSDDVILVMSETLLGVPAGPSLLGITVQVQQNDACSWEKLYIYVREGAA